MLETQKEDGIRGEEDDDLLELGSEVEEEEYNYEEDEDAANNYNERPQDADENDGREGNPAVLNECSMHLDIGHKQHPFISKRSDHVLGLATAKDFILKPQLRSQDAENSEQDSKDADACVPDAICKRTRAHYSLADMSLDQLETFLQEPDEEEYYPNVNDQEEYQKFLAAVLEEGAAPDSSSSKQDPILEEEEDDDDGDFEAEIEEALASDREGKAEGGLDNFVRQRHKIVTREKRRQRSQGQKKERLRCVGTGRLRPLIPYAESSTLRKSLEGITGEAGNGHAPATKSTIPVNGFTAHQIGQLHSLIHEHVQLLIQVFALSILEPSRQQIAIDTHKMLVEMAERRSAILSWKRSAFPDFCFRPPYIHPSVTEDFLCHSGSSSICDIVEWLQDDAENTADQDDCGSAGSSSHQTVNAVDLHSFTGNTGKILPCGSNTVAACHSATQWASSQPVRSLMDVAPLSRVQEFLANIATVVQQYMQRHVESGGYHSECEREPLFPTPKALQSQANPGSRNHDGSVVASLKTHGKRTMAAALVESTKKQSIALVPKGVVSAIQMFLPLFNPALFPHKAPPPATANRLFFTDVEDELLAMGLMTYNTDWKAIQERFLPSKTVHQIFVRQKNMSSSRAPENPIKAVRRIKSSALTSTERDSICKALKLKYNWAKVWQSCAPYRDPAILPRQWRIAQGIQKSYKMNSSCKERHRLYEANRRRAISCNKIVCLTPVPKRVPENRGPTGDASHPLGDERLLVEDAFLADGKPYSFHAIAPATAASPSKEQFRARLRRKRMKAQTPEHLSAPPPQARWRRTPEISTVPCLPFCSGAWLDGCPRSTQPDVHLQRKLAIWTVKLSPDLPSVNLPPRVHVLSQSNVYNPGSLLSSRDHSDKKGGRLDAQD